MQPQIHIKEDMHLAAFDVSSPLQARFCLLCALATCWDHSCSSSVPEAPDRVWLDLQQHEALKVT